MYRMSKQEFEGLAAQLSARLDSDEEVDMSDRAAAVKAVNRVFSVMVEYGLAAEAGHEQNGDQLYQLTSKGQAYVAWMQSTGTGQLFPGSETKGNA